MRDTVHAVVALLPRCLEAAVLSLRFLAGAAPVLASCQIPDAQEAKLAQAARLSLHTYSADDMDCAAVTALAAADAAPQNLEIQASALGIVAQTIDLMGSLKRADLMGTDVALITRIHDLSNAGFRVAEKARTAAPDSPDFKLLQALVMVGASPWIDVEQSVSTTRRAMALLTEVVDVAPATQHGLAQAVLGRMYFEMPPLLGGDVARSIDLLEDAVKRNPRNVQVWRYLAESYDQEFEEDKAIEAMKAMLAIEPGPGEYQLAADEWRLARGLAGRLQAVDLAKELAEKRSALLAQHPELLTRASTAVGGHGGDHPLTGQ